MAKLDYNSINFRNKDIDKMSGRFGNGDPEKDKARRAAQTEGMTNAQKINYNQKSRLGQKIYSKKIASENAKKESEMLKSSSESVKSKPKQTRAERVEARRNYNLSLAEKGGRGKTLKTIAEAAGSVLGAVGVYQSMKNKSNE